MRVCVSLGGMGLIGEREKCKPVFRVTHAKMIKDNLRWPTVKGNLPNKLIGGWVGPEPL